jgi:EAL domain-containing protein (putative c-di-GMP-specific phosphodiesterase class I)
VLIAVGRPFTLEGSQFTVTCSVGLALFPRDAAAPDELMRHAETAMQRAKEGGRSGYRFHKMQKKVDLRLRMRLDHSMRQALAGDGFRLHFQPQVDLSNGRVVGAEALLRWRDADLGEIPPSDFIPVAEESGFIVLIGEWVLARAVQQAAAWHARGLQLPVAINVSALQFRQHSFVERVGAALAEAGLPPQLLELELTESILVHDADEALHRLQSLAQIGVRMAIDDFGTGYSSLAYLKRFPLQRLKIDRRFVQGLPRDDSDAGIVRAIIQMARALRLTVIAEGVETEAQREFLAKAGCDMFQGFLKAPALDTVSFERQVLRVRVPELPIRTRLIAPRPIAGRAG